MKTFMYSIFFFCSFASFGQISFNTGDASFDAELNVMNTDAKKDINLFKTDMSDLFDVGKDVITGLLDKALEPAEVYLSMKIGDLLNLPVEDVVKSYEANKDKGWGAIAKDLGIKPGSPEFHELKGGMKGKGNKGNGNSGSKGKGKG